ncbi:hypothetical protein CUJ84_Chr003626 [Rhizobium leguminosarum]|uniref:Uncharacterized protein n=1 Tax=Rhizobium leguminosarum TaxID=384 RepID=A0A2K9Z6S5_RHILE|nr:hypothetical protein CUJ84_Chr003626 [Rhizobium leguminosarum]
MRSLCIEDFERMGQSEMQARPVPYRPARRSYHAFRRAWLCEPVPIGSVARRARDYHQDPCRRFSFCASIGKGRATGQPSTGCGHNRPNYLNSKQFVYSYPHRYRRATESPGQTLIRLGFVALQNKDLALSTFSANLALYIRASSRENRSLASRRGAGLCSGGILCRMLDERVGERVDGGYGNPKIRHRGLDIALGGKEAIQEFISLYVAPVASGLPTRAACTLRSSIGRHSTSTSRNTIPSCDCFKIMPKKMSLLRQATQSSRQ